MKIVCPICNLSDCLSIEEGVSEWYIDQKGFIKRKPTIEKTVYCSRCGEPFTQKISHHSRAESKETLMTEIDLTEWNIDIAINPKTEKKWAGNTNGKTWAIVRVWKENSPVYFGSAFGHLANALITDELISVVPDRVLYAQIGFNKQKRLVNGKEKTEWKQTLLFNDEMNGL